MIKMNLDFWNKLKLGKLTSEPKQIIGGFLHRMYKVETADAAYAVKVLNPVIMGRKDAVHNFITSERIAREAKQHGVNSVAAILDGGSPLRCVGEIYYLVYPWVDGGVRYFGEISEEMCRTIGGVLAQIHQLPAGELEPIGAKPEKLSINWSEYETAIMEENLPYAALYGQSVPLLQRLQERANAALEHVRKNSIGHRDMDPKNVMWDEKGSPWMIDWEAAGLVDPMQELAEMMIGWALDETGEIVWSKFYAVRDGYKKKSGTTIQIPAYAFDAVIEGKLNWLHYNIRRSLGMETVDGQEQILGTKEAEHALKDLLKYPLNCHCETKVGQSENELRE